MLLETALPVVVSGTAMFMDLCWMRVDNGWILLSLGVGFVCRCLLYKTAGIAEFAAGAVLPLLILGVLFYFRMLGAGDIKLFCALGGIMGVAEIIQCMLYSFLLGGIFSLGILILWGDFRERMRYFFQYFQEFFSTGKVKPYLKPGMTSENFHFTVPVFLSVLLYAGGWY